MRNLRNSGHSRRVATSQKVRCHRCLARGPSVTYLEARRPDRIVPGLVCRPDAALRPLKNTLGLEEPAPIGSTRTGAGSAEPPAVRVTGGHLRGAQRAPSSHHEHHDDDGGDGGGAGPGGAAAAGWGRGDATVPDRAVLRPVGGAAAAAQGTG